MNSRLSNKKHFENYAEGFSSVLGAADSADVSCETLHLEHEHPSQAIIDTAASKGCDLILTLTWATLLPEVSCEIAG